MDFQIDQEIIRGNSAYTIVEGPSWEDAEANANNLGGNLITINNQEEFQFILDNFSDYVDPTPSWEGNSSVVYIGLTDSESEGEWRWINNESSDWAITWDNNNPDNSEGRENYGILYLADTPPYWEQGGVNDVKLESEQLNGLAEIPIFLEPISSPVPETEVLPNPQIKEFKFNSSHFLGRNFYPGNESGNVTVSPDGSTVFLTGGVNSSNTPAVIYDISDPNNIFEISQWGDVNTNTWPNVYYRGVEFIDDGFVIHIKSHSLIV